MQWELADGDRWTPGNYASGASGNTDNAGATQEVAWYDPGSNDSTQLVETKAPNALGIYDMSGNVWEWCFDWYPRYNCSDRVYRSGSWSRSAVFLRVGDVRPNSPSDGRSTVGFRFVRTL